jgi:hypothetical protein
MPITMRKSIYFQVFLIVFSFLPAFGQNDSINEQYAVEDTLSDFGLFTNENIIELDLRFDITHYTRNKPKEEYMKAILTYHINDKDSINREIRLKSRGEFRNGYCSFPPVVVNFKKSDFQKNDLKEIEKMKMVTHCMSGNEENLLKEFLIYKLYNVLTDSSFRVRLVKIRYINTYKKSKPIISYSFFIEPMSVLAKRINCMPVEALSLTQKNIQPKFMDRTAIFNYMIGNTDWSVPNQHNIKVLTIPGSPTPELGLSIPYDFDYSGMVNAHYAVPAEGLKISSVRDRIFLGLCRDRDYYTGAIREFAAKKEEFYKVIREFPYLKERTKKDMLKYLDEFYYGFNKQNSIVSDFLRECKNF